MNERAELYSIKIKLISGLIGYEEAKSVSIPLIESLNKRGKEIAKKHGRKFVNTTFSQQMR